MEIRIEDGNREKGTLERIQEMIALENPASTSVRIRGLM